MSPVIGHVGKTNKSKALDIGGGLYVNRHGYDKNGNHCVWVSQGANRAKKIQTNGNTPSVHASIRADGEITKQGAAEIKDYYQRYCTPRRRRR